MEESKKNGGLGFRDIESINKALLVKWYWILIQNHSALVAVIMKEKYYKNGVLIEAKLAMAIKSLIWRSMFSSLDLIKTRLVWRVGNGSKIKI